MTREISTILVPKVKYDEEELAGIYEMARVTKEREDCFVISFTLSSI